MSETVQNYVDGEWVESPTGETFKLVNPADTSEVVAEFQQSSAADASTARSASAAAKDGWAGTPGIQRGAILKDTAKIPEEQKNELVERLTREAGKTTSEASPEVQRIIGILYSYSQNAADSDEEVKPSSGQRKDHYRGRVTPNLH